MIKENKTAGVHKTMSFKKLQRRNIRPPNCMKVRERINLLHNYLIDIFAKKFFLFGSPPTCNLKQRRSQSPEI